MKGHVTYDSEVDALYVRLRDPVGQIRTDPLTDHLHVDYDDTGAVVGVEILFASQGFSLNAVPERDRVAALLRSVSALAPA